MKLPDPIVVSWLTFSAPPEPPPPPGPIHRRETHYRRRRDIEMVCPCGESRTWAAYNPTMDYAALEGWIREHLPHSNGPVEREVISR